jgi:hypothetical protein
LSLSLSFATSPPQLESRTTVEVSELAARLGTSEAAASAAELDSDASKKQLKLEKERVEKLYGQLGEAR